MAKDLQDLKEVVNQLRRDCQECKDRHSIQRSGQKEYGEEKEVRPQIPRHNIRINETQSHSGEQVVQILLQPYCKETHQKVREPSRMA